MTNNRKLIGGIVLLVIVVAAGGWLWNFVLGDTEEASGPITAIPLELDTPAPAETESETIPAAEEVETANTESEPASEEPAASEEQAAEAQPAAAENEQTTEEQTTAEQPAEEDTETSTSTGPVIFTIIQEDSEVRFTLNELLRGAPTVVVGVTDQVAGEMAIDFNDLETTQLGPVQINARTLATDSNQRNQAIRNRILHTDSFEFITFTPTEIVGLSGSAALGESLTFQIIGDLTIRDITHSVTFDVTATPVSETRVEGTASTFVMRGDYELVIPSVPSVADVDEEVLLEIDFVAVPKA